MKHHSDSGLLIINYHYIRESVQYPYPGIHPLEPQAFIEQINWLKDRYHIATPHEVEHFYYRGKSLPGPSILLTFDDGLAEHGTLVEEVLRPLQIKAVFFISSRPLLEHRASMVHKIHWLRASSKPEKFREDFFSLLPDKMQPAEIGDGIKEKALRTYPYDTPENAQLKYLINFQLPHDTVDSVTSIMLKNRGILEPEFCERFYMRPSQVSILHEIGHMIGCHGHSHAPFAVLKIPSSTNIADNYWRKDNLIADVDFESGVIRRAIRGKGVNLEEIIKHPETGENLVGQVLPDWQEVIQVNKFCAQLFAPLRYQSLDIALSSEGPIVVEVNTGCSFELPQFASGKGFLTDDVRNFFESCGWQFQSN